MATTFLVLLGAPGAGKGTQARRLAEKLGIPHISSGDIFRANLKNQTALGRTADSYISRGQLVPDDVTVQMVEERLNQADCSRGAILDGFPRTPAQADALDRYLQERGAALTAVLYIEVSKEAVIERLSGRWICRAQGHVYHALYNPPKVRGLCDLDGSELYQREDDQPATVVKRLQVYLEQTAPLIAHYCEQDLLYTIDGNQRIDEVTDALLAGLTKTKNE